MDINDAIREVIEFTRGEAVKNGVSVQIALGEGLPLVEGDRVQLQQVVLNLVINAFQAMGAVADGARDLFIVTAHAEPDGVVVDVKDSGPGLTPTALEHLFAAVLHDEARRFGDGVVDLPFDHRSSWRTAVGEREHALRGGLSLHGAAPTVQRQPTGDPACAFWRHVRAHGRRAARATG